MILNNGRFEVDTSQADFVGKSVKTTLANGYDSEQERHFTAYRSRRTGRGFIVMAYWEFILGRWFAKATGTCVRHHLIETYADEDSFTRGRHLYGIWLDSELDTACYVNNGTVIEKI